MPFRILSSTQGGSLSADAIKWIFNEAGLGPNFKGWSDFNIFFKGLVNDERQLLSYGTFT